MKKFVRQTVVKQKKIETFGEACEKVDFFGIPMNEETDLEKGNSGPVAANNALEKPAKEDGGPEYGEKELKDKKNIKPGEVDSTPKEMAADGKSSMPAAHSEKDLPKNEVKPGDPEATPKTVGEADEHKHVGTEALATPKEKEGGKDYVEGNANAKDVKPTEPDEAPKHMEGETKGAGDGEKDAAKTIVKPGTPEAQPKEMAEKRQRYGRVIRESMLAKRKRLIEARMQKKMAKVIPEAIVKESGLTLSPEKREQLKQKAK